MAQIKFFSILQGRLGTENDEMAVHNVNELLRELDAKYGKSFTEIKNQCKIFVNGDNIGLAKGLRTPLKADDEVVFLPPTAGG